MVMTLPMDVSLKHRQTRKKLHPETRNWTVYLHSLFAAFFLHDRSYWDFWVDPPCLLHAWFFCPPWV